MAARRTACTHLTMKRLNGPYKCHVCQRLSPLGWVYICTQDWDCAGGTDTPDGPVRPGVVEYRPYQEHSTEVNPWIRKAIDKGHYTDAEAATVIKQKNNVAASANEAIARLRRIEQDKNANSMHHIGVDTDLNFDILSNSWTKAFNTSKSKQDPTTHQPPPPPPSSPPANIYPVCKFRACHRCRPTFLHRTWQIFEDVLSTNTTETLAKEEADIFDQRPVPPARIMRKIGLKNPRGSIMDRGRPQTRSNERHDRDQGRSFGRANAVPSLSQDGSDTLDSESVDITDAKNIRTNSRSKSPQRRAFNYVLDALSDIRAKRASKEKKENPLERGDDSDKHEIDLAAAAPQDILQVQSKDDELIGAAIGKGESQAGDVDADKERIDNDTDLREGVSVKEESVDLGTADIIMSV